MWIRQEERNKSVVLRPTDVPVSVSQRQGPGAAAATNKTPGEQGENQEFTHTHTHTFPSVSRQVFSFDVCDFLLKPEGERGVMKALCHELRGYKAHRMVRGPSELRALPACAAPAAADGARIAAVLGEIKPSAERLTNHFQG